MKWGNSVIGSSTLNNSEMNEYKRLQILSTILTEGIFINQSIIFNQASDNFLCSLQGC